MTNLKLKEDVVPFPALERGGTMEWKGIENALLYSWLALFLGGMALMWLFVSWNSEDDEWSFDDSYRAFQRSYY